MGRTRTIAFAAVGVLAIVAAAVIGATAGSEHADRTAGTGRTASGAPSVSPTSSATTGPVATASPGTGTSTTGSAPTATAPGAGTEILPTPAGPSSTATGYHLPPIPTASPAALLGERLPKPAVAKGRLVAGFPAALGPPQGTSVESSSIAVAGNVVQAALVLTGGDAQAIMVHYRRLLSSRGFTEQPTQGVENAPASTFGKGKDNVTVTTKDGKTYLLANLRPTSARG